MSKGQPKIYDYDNYRAYLRDAYDYLKGQKKLSYRKFSAKAGFSSINVLKNVMLGKRNLSAESIRKFCQAFEFNPSESAFFSNLVMMNQASTFEERQFYANQIVHSQSYQRFHPIQKAEYKYLNHWYYVAVRELVALHDFKEDPQWIAERLAPHITPMKARQALKELEIMGLIARDPSGRLVQSHAVVNTDDLVRSNAVIEFHRSMLNLASESLVNDNMKGLRNVSSATVGLSRKSVDKFIQLIHDFRKQLLALANEEKVLDDVFQINFQFFPLSLKNPNTEGAP